jgi:maltase-glucoamylase
MLRLGIFSVLTLCLLVLVSHSKAQSDSERIDCYPEAAYSFGQSIEPKCLERNCIWRISSTPDAPWCFFPQDTYGYTMINSTKTAKKERVYLKRLIKYASAFPDPVSDLILEVDYENVRTLRLKIYDALKTRYEVPLELKNIRDDRDFTSDFVFTFQNRLTDSVFTFKITRRSTGTVLFDTSLGAMVFCDQFLQITTILPAGSDVYGFGQNNHPSLSHDLNGKIWGMFARDEPNVAGEELSQYGVQPVYNVLEKDGNAHGVVLVNSNAMEYEFSSYPALILRSIGGIFDFYFFSGPTPEAVVQQYTSLVGYPIMIPYFALGFQLSRWDYQDLNDMKKIVQRNLDAGIPLDIQYADIEYLQDHMDFTISQQRFKDLPNYFRELQSKGMHIVPIIDPALVYNPTYKPYTDGLASDVYIKWPRGLSPDYNETFTDNMIGYCWPSEKVVYPDFLNQRSENFWINQIVDFHKVNISFDAIWIDMNEPVS